MTDELAGLIAEHPFADGLRADHVGVLAGMAARFQADDRTALFRTGETADALYLVLTGQVTLEIEQGPGAILILETLGHGDTVGWSWLFEPYRWRLDAYVSQQVDAVRIDGTPLREAVELDPEFGLAVTHRVSRLVVDRLHRARAELATARIR